MAITLPKGSNYNIPDIREVDFELKAENLVRFFNAFGYQINHDYLWRETNKHPEDFEKKLAGTIMTVGHALELIERDHSWIRVYRIHKDERFSIPWIADNLRVSPVEVMGVIQTSSEVTAKMKANSGIYFVNESDLDTLRVMLTTEPVPHQADPLAEVTTEAVSEEESATPDDHEASEDEQIPSDNYEDGLPLPFYPDADVDVPPEEVSLDNRFTLHQAELLAYKAVHCLWETKGLINAGRIFTPDDFESIGWAYVVSLVAEEATESGDRLEDALEIFRR